MVVCNYVHATGGIDGGGGGGVGVICGSKTLEGESNSTLVMPF